MIYDERNNDILLTYYNNYELGLYEVKINALNRISDLNSA